MDNLEEVETLLQAALNAPQLENQMEYERQLNTMLNFQQKQAVLHALELESKLVIIKGGPATGKTRTISILVCGILRNNQQALVITSTEYSRLQISNFVVGFAKAANIPTSETTFMHYDKYMDVKHPAHLLLDETERRKKILSQTMVVIAVADDDFIEKSQDGTNFRPKIALIDDIDHLDETQYCQLYETMDHLIVTEDGAKNLRVDTPPPYISLLEKLSDCKTFRLDYQYRMNEKIAAWSKEYCYKTQLRTDSSVANISLRNVPYIKDNVQKELKKKIFEPFVLCDTGNVGKDEDKTSYYEKLGCDGSYYNEGEASLAVRQATNLLRTGIFAEDMAILTPFKSQKKLIISRMLDVFEGDTHITVETINSFQTEVRDVIIFSMVRCNPRAEFGSLVTRNMINVAITRSKRQFFYIGSKWMLLNSNWMGPFEALSNMFMRPSVGTYVSPRMLFGRAEPKTRKISHSFGKEFKLFIANSNDETMKEKCRRMRNNR